MEHFNQGNAYGLCTARSSTDVRAAVGQLNASDLDTVRRLPSFRRYVESLVECRHVIAVLTDDEALRQQLPGMLQDVRVWLRLWYGALRLLLAIVQELPRSVQLGRQLRDLYAQCAASAVVESPALQAAWELLAMLSRDELLALLQRCAVVLEAYGAQYCGRQSLDRIEAIVVELRAHADRIRAACQVNATSPEEVATAENGGGSGGQAAFSSQTKVLSRAEMQAVSRRGEACSWESWL